MKVISVIVDGIPNGCESCVLKRCINGRYYCTPLMAEMPFGVYFRRHDCPLVAQSEQAAE